MSGIICNTECLTLYVLVSMCVYVCVYGSNGPFVWGSADSGASAARFLYMNEVWKGTLIICQERLPGKSLALVWLTNMFRDVQALRHKCLMKMQNIFDNIFVLKRKFTNNYYAKCIFHVNIYYFNLLIFLCYRIFCSYLFQMSKVFR